MFQHPNTYPEERDRSKLPRGKILTTTRTRSRGNHHTIIRKQVQKPLIVRGRFHGARLLQNILFFSPTSMYQRSEGWMELEEGRRGRRGHTQSWREFREGISLCRELIWEGKKTKIGTTPGFAAQRATFFAQLWNSGSLFFLFCYLLVFLFVAFFAALVVGSAGLFLFAHGLLTLLRRSSHGMF